MIRPILLKALNYMNSVSYMMSLKNYSDPSCPPWRLPCWIWLETTKYNLSLVVFNRTPVSKGLWVNNSALDFHRFGCILPYNFIK